ncbi:MAG: thiamine pyrophosphate-dependent enzyme [Acidobacteriota bacterium]
MNSELVDLKGSELVHPGHLGCQGCGASLVMKNVLEGLGKDTIIVLPAGCWTVLAGPFPNCSVDVPVLHTAFETAASTASGVRAGLDALGDTKTTVVPWAGDGATFDIGFQALSGVAERNDDLLYVCYDNEAYMNTGIQQSSATPHGAWTTTTPKSKKGDKKDILRVLAAHRIPYFASACISYPEDLVVKVRKAKSIKGFRFLHVLAPCPPGWKISSEMTIKIGRMAVQSRIFPLVEVENGRDFKLSEMPDKTPVAKYLRMQGRFKSLGRQEMQEIQAEIDYQWEALLRDCERNC